ncbi:MAG: hypothetical protein ACYTE8_13045 [Planctomycetota bacterium]|jgi:hypothetical protein
MKILIYLICSILLIIGCCPHSEENKQKVTNKGINLQLAKNESLSKIDKKILDKCARQFLIEEEGIASTDSWELKNNTRFDIEGLNSRGRANFSIWIRKGNCEEEPKTKTEDPFNEF